MIRTFLSFRDTRIRLDVEESVEPCLRPALRFLRHAITPQAGGPANFVVRVIPYASATDRSGVSQGEVIIRRSTAPEFNIVAHWYRTEDRHRYVNQRCILETPVRCTGRNDSFTLAIRTGAQVQVIDFLRDLIIRHEENLGAISIHAAGVLTGHGGWAIAGSKGAGKTTTLLSLIHSPELRYWSGDKLFLEEGASGFSARAWPDWPHIGAGTIRHIPWLQRHVARELDIDPNELASDRKLLIDPDVFARWIDLRFSMNPVSLTGLLCPQFVPGKPLELSVIDDPERKWAIVNQIIERSADTSFFGWQTYLVPDYFALYANVKRLRSRLARLPFVAIRGAIGPELARMLESWMGLVRENEPGDGNIKIDTN